VISIVAKQIKYRMFREKSGWKFAGWKLLNKRRILLTKMQVLFRAILQFAPKGYFIQIPCCF
jgi:hypothetical protein